MAFWSKKKAIEILIKSLKSDNVSFKENDNVISFEYQINDSILYPYLKFDEETDYASIVINIKKQVLKGYEKINEFNINSRYFKAAVKDDLVYLSYAFTADDNIRDELNKILGSLNPLIDIIENF